MLNPDKKLYQLIISRLDGDKLSSIKYQDSIVELVRRGIGGFIIFGGSRNEVKGFVDKLQYISDTPIFIASDIERGVGQQLEGGSDFPCQMAVAAALNRNKSDNVNTLENMIRAIASEAIDAGINMPLIPVLDVNRNPDNPIICTRAFSDNPEDVAWYGHTYIKGLEKAGLISCAKHFPGHGDTMVDSHISLPVISKSYDELMEADITPFKEAVKAGVSSIMLGHLSVPAIDSLPAPFSNKMVAGLLRQELGYEGLILTDALNMHALNEYEGVPAKCINAGADILLHPADADSVFEELKQAVASGEIAEEIIDTAVERILKYKLKIKDIQKVDVHYKAHAELSGGITQKSITLAADTSGILPVKNFQKTSIVYAGDENARESSILGEFIPSCIDMGKYKGKVINQTVIFALFTSVAAWKGSSGISDEEITKIKNIKKKALKTVVISFGSPYVLRHFTEADALIAAYDSTEQAQSAVIRCLKGEKEFTGRLPVKF